jgi:uridine kinase
VSSARTVRALRLIGLDGPGAAGKSTLAGELGAVVGASVIATDDFYLPAARRPDPIADHYDWRRLEQEVFLSVLMGRPARYRRYDWTQDALAEWHNVPAERPGIVEGVYVLRPGVRAYLTYSIWVGAPHEVRLRRGLERDGVGARARWEAWMRSEDEYVRHVGPAQIAARNDKNASTRTLGVGALGPVALDSPASRRLRGVRRRSRRNAAPIR